jgi:transposase
VEFLIMTLTTGSLGGRVHTGGVTDDEIDPAARPVRRSFSAEYKAEILAEYDSHPKGSPERGAILRREALYSSHISEWRKQAEAGAREGLAAKSKKRRSRAEVELDKLRARNARLEDELAKTKTSLEITGKVHALLEQLSESADTDPRSKP